MIGFTEPLLALENFQKNSESFGLVISDIMMPVINGYQFTKEVKKIRPLIKVFFMSSFYIDYIQFRTELPFIDIDEIIQKPISIENFIKTVSRHMTS